MFKKFKNKLISKSKAEQYAEANNIVLANEHRGMSVDGLSVTDFAYLTQKYTDNELICLTDWLKLNDKTVQAQYLKIRQEMKKDVSTGQFRENSSHAAENFQNFSNMVRKIFQYWCLLNNNK